MDADHFDQKIYVISQSLPTSITANPPCRSPVGINQQCCQRKMKDRLLDNMELERERGITIKAQTVCLNYKAANGTTYVLNLVDTPGHVDFSYEVSRSLASCEGALLVVDVSQGVQAQTLANVYMAIDNNLEILPVLNKIDLPHADVEGVKDEIENIIGIDTDEAIEVSAKSGLGVERLLEYIVDKIPSPKGEALAPSRPSFSILGSIPTKELLSWFGSSTEPSQRRQNPPQIFP